MNPLSRLFGFLYVGCVTPKRPAWRAPKLTDAGTVTRQMLRHLDRKQPDLAAVMRAASQPGPSDLT